MAWTLLGAGALPWLLPSTPAAYPCRFEPESDQPRPDPSEQDFSDQPAPPAAPRDDPPGRFLVGVWGGRTGIGVVVTAFLRVRATPDEPIENHYRIDFFLCLPLDPQIGLATWNRPDGATVRVPIPAGGRVLALYLSHLP
jgi:hypothetical protein